jgi:glutathione peroxidase
VTFQYTQLNALQEEFSKNNQFTILGIPCNQFGYQEPAETKHELLNGLKYVRPGENFVPNFPLFWIVDVNGKHQHPLYEYLKSCVPPTKKSFEDHTMIFYEPHHSDDIRWNFEKFLIDSNGHPIMRFDSDAEPLFIRQFIEKLLQL